MNTLHQKQFKVVLIGDNCIDEYHYGTVNRLSPEAPVPILSNPKIVKKPGMAANVKANLEALGVEVKFYTRNPSIKIRLLDEKTNHHLLRIDYDTVDNSFISPITIDEIDLTDVDAVVISDYDKGVVDTSIGKQIRNKFSGPIFVDTKKTFYGSFPGSIVKVNSLEANLAKWNFSTIKNLEKFIVTDGPNSVTVYQHKSEKPPVVKYDVNEVKAFDVCGAGDTFLAALTYGHLVFTEEEAIKFAIKASSVTIQHIGVYAPTLLEIYNVI